MKNLALNKLQNFTNQSHIALYDTLTWICISLTYVFQVLHQAIFTIPLRLWTGGSITCLKGNLLSSSHISSKSLFKPK